ncbi:MAG: hypothetical protein GF398_15370 [Chitinivibrionales bacterium]|nr:hypothetical protein [Chitinivibrionales bacterium]
MIEALKKNMNAATFVLLAAANLPAQQTRPYDPFVQYDKAMNVLLAWGLTSTVVGAGLLASEDRPLRRIGISNISWGTVNTGIALLAKQGNRVNRSKITPQEKISNFRKAMVINGLLDLAYIGTGVGLMTLANDKQLNALGVSFAYQGGFLLGFDWINFGLTFQ